MTNAKRAPKPKDPAHPKGRPCKVRPCRHDNQLAAAKRPGRPPAGQGKRDAAGRVMIKPGPVMSAIIAGEIDISQWDDEEVLRGQQRIQNGNKRGQFPADPSIVPYKSVQEFRRRFFSTAGALMQRNLVSAVAVITEFITDPDQDPKLRLDAAKWLVDKLTGKAPQHTTLSLEGSVELTDHEGIARALADRMIQSTSRPQTDTNGDGNG